MAGSRPYHIINLVLAVIIGGIFIYSALYSAERDDHPIPSFSEKISGQKAPSSGMSRAFSEIIRGRFDSAREYNRDSLLLFFFFLVQGIQRIFVSFLLLRGRIRAKPLMYADISLSVLMFLLCFGGQISSFFKLLSP